MRARTAIVEEGPEVETLRAAGWRTLRRMGGFRVMVLVTGRAA